MRRVALLVAVLFLLFFTSTVLAVVVATSALGDASGDVRLLVGVAAFTLFFTAIWLVGRSVRRMFGPIGDVLEAADRVAGGDYSVRVTARGPGEVRRLGRTFNEMTARIEASDQQRRRLLADVTHELRTPLAVIQGNLEGIADGVYPADEERVGAVLEETRLMARLLDDLQTLSTAEAGALQLVREATDLRELAFEVTSAFAPQAAAAGIRLAASPADETVTIADPFRVRQVLENLVTNALRVTPPGGDVTIAVARAEREAEIAVTDTGPGIPEEELAAVFDRYTRSADSGGSGLGLAIARSLVEAHGGTITAARAPGGGTTMRVRLPLEPGRQED
jgi:two-component system, OmpR family, sensor histidine kinase BaeS